MPVNEGGFYGVTRQKRRRGGRPVFEERLRPTSTLKGNSRMNDVCRVVGISHDGVYAFMKKFLKALTQRELDRLFPGWNE